MKVFNIDNTDYFQTIRELFDNDTFCDLKIVATKNKENEYGADVVSTRPIFCHSLVLCAALPELKPCLLSTHPPIEDHRTLILVGYNRTSIQLAIDGIYTELVNYSGKPHKKPWLESFGLLSDYNLDVYDQDVENEITKPEHEQILSTSEEVLEQELLNPIDGQLMTIAHHGDEEDHLDYDPPLNIETGELMESKFVDENTLQATLKNQSLNDFNKIVRKRTKSQKISLKDRKSKPDNDLEKVCFGCLKTFPYSTCKERKLYLKHTLIHCKCECAISFKTKVNFEKHMKTVHKGHLYKCDFENCNSKSTLLKEFIRHRQKHAQCSKEESNICPDCGREFINSYYMKAHYGSRHKKMKCKICGVFTFGTDDNQKHHNAVHKPNLVCELCGKNFKTKSTLRCHVVNVHTPEDQRPYKCDFCPKGFLNSRYLLTHVERDHKGNRAFTCRALGCDRTFTLPEVRKRHEKRDHNLNINLKPGVTSKFEVHSSTFEASKDFSSLNGPSEKGRMTESQL